MESQGWGSKVQHYKVIDAALGVIERGTWKVADAVEEQPWLPNGPIPTEVTWALVSERDRVERTLNRDKRAISRDKGNDGHGALA